MFIFWQLLFQKLFFVFFFDLFLCLDNFDVPFFLVNIFLYFLVSSILFICSICFVISKCFKSGLMCTSFYILIILHWCNAAFLFSHPHIWVLSSSKRFMSKTTQSEYLMILKEKQIFIFHFIFILYYILYLLLIFYILMNNLVSLYIMQFSLTILD